MIPLDQIARLAEIYDQYNNALDPLSKAAEDAKRKFETFTANLHSAHAPEVEFSEFRYELVRHCREYLRKNPP